MEREQKEKHCKFVSPRGKTNTKDYYNCFRSGPLRTTLVRRRKIKSQGSNKIDHYCPATIEVVTKEDGKLVVKYQKNHLGHKHDKGRICLTRAERIMLAGGFISINCTLIVVLIECYLFSGRLRDNPDLNLILDDIRDSACDLSPMSLLTKQDLRNILRDFNLFKGRMDNNDKISVI